MQIQFVTQPISLTALKALADKGFGDMVKAVVDLRRGFFAINAEMHADLEIAMLEKGSEQEDLWGINLYPDRFPDDGIEYHSLINIRPKQNNRTMEIDDPKLRENIRGIVMPLIKLE